MTQIDFYFHVENKLHTACALSAKACARGLRVLAFCADADAGMKFSRLLWTTQPVSFIPHCTPGDPLAAVTPSGPTAIDCSRNSTKLIHRSGSS